MDESEMEKNFFPLALSLNEESDFDYHSPVFGMESQGSSGGRECPFCKSSIEIKSGDRMKAILPSLGGRLMVIPLAEIFAQVS